MLEEGFAEQFWCCTTSLELLGFTVQVAAVVNYFLIPALVGIDVASLVLYCAVPG